MRLVKSLQVTICCAHPDQWAVLHYWAYNPTVHCSSAARIQERRGLPQEPETLACSDGDGTEVVAVGKLAVQGYPKKLEVTLSIQGDTRKLYCWEVPGGDGQ